MMKAAWEKISGWWINKGWPWIRLNVAGVASRWWDDLGDNPSLHFISMVMGLALYFIVKLVVKLVA